MLLGDFFFSSRRRHTRYWRDWSSDVCSSDLIALEGGQAGDGAAHVEDLVAAAGLERAGPARVRVQALLDDVDLLDRRLGLLRGLRLRLGRGGDLATGARGLGGLRVVLGELELLADVLARDRARARDRVLLGDLLQVRVRVGVAVAVAQLDEAAQALAGPDLHDLAVLDGDDGRAGLG